MPFWFYFTPVIYPVSTLIPENWRWLVVDQPDGAVVEAFKWGTLGQGHITAASIGNVACR